MLFIFLVLGNINYFVSAENRKNVALFKSTSQSSTVQEGSSERAVDGLVYQHYDDHSCTHTSDEEEPWWTVDLGANYDIDSIIIYNRKDCCGDRLSDYSVFIYNSTWTPSTDIPGVLCYFHAGKSPEIVHLTCDRRSNGRFVKITKTYNPTKSILTLCEVQVFGKTGNLESWFCKSVRRKPIKLAQSYHHMTEVKCAATCFTADICLGYIIRSGGICDLYQTSKTVDTADYDLNYYEKC